jgi:hypothetical protein
VTILDIRIQVATLTYRYRVAAPLEFAAHSANTATLRGIILAISLEAYFAVAETVDAVPVDLVAKAKLALNTKSESWPPLSGLLDECLLLLQGWFVRPMSSTSFT